MQCETAMVVISHKFGFIYSQTTPLSSFIVLAIHDFNIQPCLTVGTPRKHSIAHPETHLFQLVTRAHPMPLTSFESTTSKSTSSSWVGRKIRGSSSQVPSILLYRNIFVSKHRLQHRGWYAHMHCAFPVHCTCTHK